MSESPRDSAERGEVLASFFSSLGMLLQFAGLALLPFAVLANLASSDSYVFGVSNMLVAMIAGLVVFYIGWFIRGYAENSPGDEEDDDESPPRKKKKKGK